VKDSVLQNVVALVGFDIGFGGLRRSFTYWQREKPGQMR